MRVTSLNSRGFTFIELIVALTLMGIVSGSIYSLLNNNQRVYREQAARIDLNQNVRAAIAILPTDLRELDAADGDIIAMSATSITYRAYRNTYFLCSDAASAANQVTVLATAWTGLHAFDRTIDSLIIYREGSDDTRFDDSWRVYTATAATTGTACSGLASLTLTLAGPNATVAILDGIDSGAPLRGYQVVRMSAYTDANGDTWLGSETGALNGTFSAIQPIVGPLSPGGLAFTYYDANGAVTATRANVRRIGISITGQTQDNVRKTGGALGKATQTITTHVALRNNPRY